MSCPAGAMRYDVVVVGAGHAGCEAALAASRMGFSTLLLTLNLDSVAQMSCNPAIGGLAKGHLVREIDAMGGEMGKVIDLTGIQFRMLNTGRGRAVQAIRAQADKKAYQHVMRRTIESQERLRLMQGNVVRLTPLAPRDGQKNIECRGAGRTTPADRIAEQCSWQLETEAGLAFLARCLILSPGTFLNGRIHVGTSAFEGGRAGELSAPHLSRCLADLGFELGRLKTGTSPRLARRSIDFSRLTPQLGDVPPPFFSYSTVGHRVEQVPCHIAWTNPKTHLILRENLDRSPLFTGRIKGVGPRYCPSIEDKVVRFPARESHQLFLEPEGVDSEEIYASGISTSMPADVQEEFVHSIEGLERAEIMRPGYAVEYDFVPPTYLKASLQTRSYPTLFLAGQINGTSGYEEAAAQGLMAGINAALLLRGEEPIVLDRAEAYVGVLIDDLVTRGTSEPYRMFTSQAEYRLLLRHDNADERLMQYGHRLGLINQAQYSSSCARMEEVKSELERLEKSFVSPEDADRLLASASALPGAVAGTSGTVSIGSLLRRPEVNYGLLVKHGMASERPEIGELVEIRIKYAGYIRRQERSIEQFRKLENVMIPQELFSEDLRSVSKEARERLCEVRPRSIGQASRLPGVSPSDISALLIYLKRASARNSGKT
ncbi:MAG: tRNA uridine-5-carboxymethylaminomethyl(34) synthesis enzyme MnmG [Candidatus Eisenbacteria bacterium]|nr:tRNA uridine-5-carboxymethylaminomethyl(34) synthesis enzyme MnmG [Candidatus Eisenbacteria bacterium]